MELNLLYEMQNKEIELQSIKKRIKQLIDDDLLQRLKNEYSDLLDKYLILSNTLKNEVSVIESKKKSIIQLEENKKNYKKLKYSPEINNSKKLQMIEKQIDDVSDNINREIKEIDAINKKTNNIKEEIITIKKKIVFINNKLEKTKNQIESDLKILKNDELKTKNQLKEVKDKIDKESIENYLKLKIRFDDPVSLIVSRKCTGCSVDVPSINYEAVRAGDIVKCESCGRVLLYRKE